MRILLTKPLETVTELSEKIRAMGDLPEVFPTIDIQPLPPSTLDIHAFQKAYAAIFASRQAVRFALPRLPSLASLLWIAIGPGTANALEQHGVQKILLPATMPYESESLLQIKPLQQIHQKNIWLFKGKGGRTLLSETLRQRGAKLTIVEVYKRDLPKLSSIESLAKWPHNSLDVIVTTSADCLNNLITLLGTKIPDLKTIPIVVVGSRMFDLATQLEFKKPILATGADDLTIMNVLNDLKGQTK